MWSGCKPTRPTGMTGSSTSCCALVLVTLFGGLAGTLDGARRTLRPGGQVLLGDAIWEAPPSAVAQQVLQAGPEDFSDLPGLVDRVREWRFEPGYGHVSTLEEWDDYEWSWTGSFIAWALKHRQDPVHRDQALSPDAPSC